MIFLDNPKNQHNVGGAIRASSCFDGGTVAFSGPRMKVFLDEVAQGGKKARLPREERMKGYVGWEYIEDFRALRHRADTEGLTPVCVEIWEGAIPLPYFEHPENPVYIFGPEDGSVSRTYREMAHQFVYLPTLHCTNLSSAVYLTLYDRHVKRSLAGLEAMHDPAMAEERGFPDHEGFELE